MKKIWTAVVILTFSASLAIAEPILTQDAKCIEKGNMEIGLSVSYGADAWTINGVTGGADYKTTLLTEEIPVKYGLNEKLQLGLNIPNRSWKYEVSPDPLNLGDSDSGLGQIAVNGKYSLCENFAAGVDIQTQTGDVKKSLGEGMDAGLFLIASKKLDPVEISGNVGYIMKSEYKVSGIKYNPGDPIVIRAAAEYPINEYSLLGEVQSQIFGKEKIAGADLASSNGSTLDFLVGGQYLKDAMKLKLGFEFGAGSDDYRVGGPFFRFYDSWDWKIILAGSYKFEI